MAGENLTFLNFFSSQPVTNGGWYCSTQKQFKNRLDTFSIFLKFQEEIQRNGVSFIEALQPEIVLKRNDLPFILLFYKNNEEDSMKEFSDSSQHIRKKRYIEITPDLDIDHNNYYSYTHESITDDDNKIIDENKNGIEDIDEEDELVLDFENDLIPIPRRFKTKKNKRRRNRRNRK